MSEVIGEGVVRIRTDETGVDVDGAGRTAGQGYVKGFGSSLKKLAGIIGVALAAGKTIDFLKGAVAEGREAQKIGAATTQIIKATGGAANITASQVGDLTSAISAKAGVDDEAIQSGANLLLTFKQVRNEVGQGNDIFNRATQAAVDLSAAGFGSIEGGAKMLGKALNDPLKGISALSRAGVTFTQAQQDQIKALVASGDTLKAQKIILGEVEGQVGGVAAATATAGEKASVAWGNIKEQIGLALIPALDALATVFVDQIAPAISSVVDNASRLSPVFAGIGAAITSAFGSGGGGGALDSARETLSTLAPVLQSIAAQAVPVFVGLGQSLATNFLPVLVTVRDLVVTQLLPAWTALVSYIAANVYPVFLQVVQIIGESVVPLIATLAEFLYGTLYPAVLQIVEAVAVRLKPAFDALVEVFQTQILPTVQKVVNQIRTQLVPALEPVVMKVVMVIGFLLKLAATILGFVLPPLLKLAGLVISHVIPALVTVIVWVVKFIGWVQNLGVAITKGIVTLAKFWWALESGVAKGVAAVVSGISSLPGKVLGFVGRLVSAGRDLIGGLLRGMGDAAHGVGGFISGIASSVGSAISTAARAAINAVITAANNAIPNSISTPGPVPDIDLPDNPIPHLQSGTRSARGGFYTVGEVGPERVYLPRGARVLTAAQTRQADGIDYNALAAALATALAPILAGQRPVQFMLPSGDPEAAAMAAVNRLIAVGG